MARSLAKCQFIFVIVFVSNESGLGAHAEPFAPGVFVRQLLSFDVLSQFCRFANIKFDHRIARLAVQHAVRLKDGE